VAYVKTLWYSPEGTEKRTRERMPVKDSIIYAQGQLGAAVETQNGSAK
jgi:hypothetical protein